jgi:hypothetical protein
MDLFPLSHVGALLGIDPKTLRLWLHEAALTAVPHPEDARQKCLTLTQVQHLAETHGRPLPRAFLASAAAPPSLPPPEVHAQLAQMQQQIFTLPEQVTRLSLALLQLSSARPSPLLAPPTASASAPTVVALPPAPDAPPPPRPPSRAVPMIAFTVDGCYQVVDPDKGILPLTPDSPQWFAWLASTNTLTFQGRHGSFTASRRFRRGKRVQSWTVYRCLHSRSCTLYAGMTMTLTTARLEGLAQQLLTRLAPL